MLSATRDMDAARRFFRSAQSMVNSAPKQVTTDGHDAYPRAIRETLGPKVRHRCSAYLNRRIEQDHRGVKQRYYRCWALARFPGPAILSSLRGSSAVLSSAPKAERSYLTLQCPTTVSLPSARTGSAVPRSVIRYNRLPPLILALNVCGVSSDTFILRAFYDFRLHQRPTFLTYCVSGPPVPTLSIASGTNCEISRAKRSNQLSRTGVRWDKETILLSCDRVRLRNATPLDGLKRVCRNETQSVVSAHDSELTRKRVIAMWWWRPRRGCFAVRYATVPILSNAQTLVLRRRFPWPKRHTAVSSTST
jgi:hypothetical protein